MASKEVFLIMKKKLLSILIIISMFAGVGLFATACGGNGTPTPRYTVTIVDPPAGITNFTVMDGETRIESGTQVTSGTVLTINWESDVRVVLNINGEQFVPANLPHTHIVTGATAIALTHYAWIRDVASLSNMSMSGTYRLGANLTLTDWTPIGTTANPFTGRLFAELDASGQPEYTIASLEILETYAVGDLHFAALIGVNAGTVRNIHIEELNIDIDVDTLMPNGRVFVGGIAGFNDGEIINAYIKGEINAVASNGGIMAGLVVGHNTGADAIIKDSVVSGSIKVEHIGNDDNPILSASNRVGGLVGLLSDEATVLRSAAHVDVSVKVGNVYGNDNISSGSSNAAGLVGHIDSSATIRQSFATGDAIIISYRETSYAAGLVGNISVGADDVVRIIETFAIGNATATANGGNAYVAGLIGRIDDRLNMDIYIRDSYATGNAQIKSTITYGDNNHYVGGLIGRADARAGGVIWIENCVATGDVRGSSFSTTNDNFANFLVGRFQGSGASRVAINNYTRYGSVLEGLDDGDNERLIGIRTSIDLLTDYEWQLGNLGWDPLVWTFVDGYFPTLTWSV